jgi:hypothetical protein
MSLRFFFNTEAFVSEMGEFKNEVKAALDEAVKSLAAMTHAHVVETANKELSSTRKKFLDNLGFEEISSGIWVVSVDEPALFIEDGRKAGPMHEDLLKNGAKVSKDGHRYRAIPFEHSKPDSQMSGFAQGMKAKIRSELKKAGVPFKKIEYNADGSPRLGALHRFNFSSPEPSQKASHPALSGVTIYQTKTPSGGVRRDILTFRVISEKRMDKWHHPGLQPKDFLGRALQWAEQTWESEVLPAVMARFE